MSMHLTASRRRFWSWSDCTWGTLYRRGSWARITRHFATQQEGAISSNAALANLSIGDYTPEWITSRHQRSAAPRSGRRIMASQAGTAHT